MKSRPAYLIPEIERIRKALRTKRYKKTVNSTLKKGQQVFLDYIKNYSTDLELYHYTKSSGIVSIGTEMRYKTGEIMLEAWIKCLEEMEHFRQNIKASEQFEKEEAIGAK